jgi:hypothetical protein
MRLQPGGLGPIPRTISTLNSGRYVLAEGLKNERAGGDRPSGIFEQTDAVDTALPLLGKACLNALVRSLFAPLGRIV